MVPWPLESGLHDRNGGLARPLLFGMSSLLSALVAGYTMPSFHGAVRSRFGRSLQEASSLTSQILSSKGFQFHM